MHVEYVLVRWEEMRHSAVDANMLELAIHLGSNLARID